MSDEQPLNVLNLLPLEDESLEKIQAVSPRIQITSRRPDEEGGIGDDLDQFEVLFTPGPLPDPEEAPNLAFAQWYWAGVENALEHPLFDGEVALCSASGVHAVNLAEFAMALILAHAHHLPSLLDHQRRIDWPSGRNDLFIPNELFGSTLGIVGYGSIGRHLARLGKGFGMQVLAMKRDAMSVQDTGFVREGVGDPEGDLPDRIYPPQALHSFLAECDYVVILVPLTEATHHLIGAEALAAMKPTAFLVNVARGPAVDTAALLAALQNQKIAGAALDVFEQEPLSEHSPLWDAPNLIVTPHIGGLTAHYEARAADIFAENLRRYLAGEPLLNRVDRGRGY